MGNWKWVESELRVSVTRLTLVLALSAKDLAVYLDQAWQSSYLRIELRTRDCFTVGALGARAVWLLLNK